MVLLERGNVPFGKLMGRTDQLLLRNALILVTTRLSICQESIGTLFRSLPNAVIPTFCRLKESPIAESTPMHLPLSAALALAGGAAAGGFGAAGSWASAAPAKQIESRTSAARRIANPAQSAAKRSIYSTRRIKGIVTSRLFATRERMPSFTIGLGVPESGHQDVSTFS
jgi:hypothetical protein